MVCADGIQECIETIQDLKANNAEQSYMAGLDTKIDNVEKRSIINEFGTSTFVVSAGLVLKLGIATTALVGSILLVNGQLDVLTFFMFLLVVSRLYDPMQSALQNLAAIISTNTNVARMNEILDHDVQTGNTRLTNKGYDVKFKNVNSHTTTKIMFSRMFRSQLSKAKLPHLSAHQAAVKLPYQDLPQDSGILTRAKSPWAVWIFPRLNPKLCYHFIQSFSKM